jgi:hypothetical protein
MCTLHVYSTTPFPFSFFSKIAHTVRKKIEKGGKKGRKNE